MASAIAEPIAQFSVEDLATAKETIRRVVQTARANYAYVAASDAACIASTIIGLNIKLDVVTDTIVNAAAQAYLEHERTMFEADYALVIANLLQRYLAKTERRY